MNMYQLIVNAMQSYKPLLAVKSSLDGGTPWAQQIFPGHSDLLNVLPDEK